MQTKQASSEDLTRAETLGFVTQLKIAGKTDAEIPVMYKRATAFVERQLTKRANLKKLIVDNFVSPKAPAA